MTNDKIQMTKMEKEKLREVWWTIAAAYILLIYSTLTVAPAIWESIDVFFGGKTIIILYSLYFIAAVSVLYYLIHLKREMYALTYVLFFLFIAVLFMLMKLVKGPAEKIHVAEYAMLGVILYNALKVDLDVYRKKLYFCGSLICVLVGFGDEIIQKFLPGRFFGWRDVTVNAVSGIIALLMIRFVILKKS